MPMPSSPLSMSWNTPFKFSQMLDRVLENTARASTLSRTVSRSRRTL